MSLTNAEIEKIKALFKEQDLDGDEYITLEEFKVILGEGFTDEDVRGFLAEADANADGKITLDEYLSASE